MDEESKKLDSRSGRGRPAAACSAKEAWNGREVKVQLLGKKYINGKTIMEEYNLTIECSAKKQGVNHLCFAILEEVKHLTDIPADLLQGFNFKFV